jgi:hypothetical protein
LLCGTWIAAASVVPRKGLDYFTISWFLKQVDLMGVVEVALVADQEESIQAVLRQVKERRGQPTQIRSSPRRSPQSIGGVGRYHRFIQDQIRKTRFEVEKRLNITLSMQHIIAPWLVRHCSWTLHRFHVSRETGLTGFSRLVRWSLSLKE